MERWECSHIDNDWLMTGRLLGEPLRFDGKKKKLVLFAPPMNGQTRAIEYPDTKLKPRLRLAYGLADNSREGCRVQFNAYVDGQPLYQDLVQAKGMKEMLIDTSSLAGKNARVRFTSHAEGDATSCIFAFDGGPE
jgi:hypothetical protein